MTSFRDAFAPPVPGSKGPPVAQSVQSSLYQRLRKSHGSQAGALGWLLVRIGQPDHRDFDESCSLIMGRPLPELAALSLVVGAARARAATPAARELCDAIEAMLLNARSVASMKAAPK